MQLSVSLRSTSTTACGLTSYFSQTPPNGGLLAPCVKLGELHLGGGFVEIPDAIIHCVLDSRSLSHLTTESPDGSQAIRATWAAVDQGLVRL